MQINGTRLWDSLMQMATIGATKLGGSSRLALTEEDRQGRDLFIQWCKDENMIIQRDIIGNLFAVRLGDNSNLPPIVMGSHLDTQPKGGKFDGIYGVLSALEVVRTFNENKITTPQNLEIAVWMNEEGARFSPAMQGSAVFIGELPLEQAYQQTDHAGISVIESMKQTEQMGDLPLQRVFNSYFEAHIEQGPVLENSGSSIGIVTGGQAILWFDITIQGFPLHAGTTPMHLRKDPLMGTAEILVAIEAAAKQINRGLLTVGEISIATPSRNTIPDQITFTLDIRHPDLNQLDQLKAEIENIIQNISTQRNLTFTMTEIWRSPAIAFNAQCVDLVRNAVQYFDYKAEEIISGAGHDAIHLAKHCPTTMIFIPCEKGISHNEAENITAEYATQGANVLLHAVNNRANQRQ